MSNPLNDSDYVTFTRRFVKGTVATMDIEELRGIVTDHIHEMIQEEENTYGQEGAFDDMIGWDEDVFEKVAKDYPIVLEDTEGWTDEDFADYHKETFIDINNTGGKY